MKNNRTLILNGSLLKAILVLGLPIMLNNLIQSLYNLGDAFWVSRIGDTEVAAVNFAWPVSFLTISLALGISVAGAAIISQHIGGERYEEANQTASQLYLFSIIFGIIGGIIGILATPTIVKLMGADGDLYIASVQYLKILFVELPILFILNIYFSINQAQGETIGPTILNASSALLNVILDPLFIFTFHLGIKGAAIATVLSKVPFAAYAIYRLSKGSKFIKINPIKVRLIKDKMSELIKIGIPSSIGNCGVAFGFIILHVFVVKYGEYAVAALGIGNKLNSLAFMPAVGIGAALTTITGQNLGANNPARVKKAFLLSLMLSFAFLTSAGGLLWIFSRNIVGIFSNTEAVLSMGSYYLRALALTTWSIAFFNCTLGILNGSGHTMHSMFLDAGRLWIIRLPLIVILGYVTTLGVKSIWIGVGISNVLAGLLALVIASTGVWKTSKVKSGVSFSISE